MTFWLGVHNPAFLGRTAVPCCVHFGHLRGRRRLPRPRGPVLIDSWGFTELQRNGTYTFAAREYAATVRRCAAEWGDKLAGASIMDWMCEPDVRLGNPAKGFVGTSKSVREHQTLTVNSWLELNAIDGTLPWVPVLQGFEPDEYHEHVQDYLDFGCTRLGDLPMVGLGSVCRRQGMAEAGAIVRGLYARGLKNLHGFGFKVTGLVSKGLRLARYLASADSMSWSRVGRNAWKFHRKTLCYCHSKGSANCLCWALRWRQNLVRRVESVTRGGVQQILF